MYEYRNGDGEIVTVRSLKTLERLLADAAIREGTPFRAGGEPSFVPASTHPLVGRLASEMALPFVSRASVKAVTLPDPDPDAEQPRQHESPREFSSELATMPSQSGPLAEPPDQTEAAGRLAFPWGALAVAPPKVRPVARPNVRPVDAPKGISRSSAVLSALVWQCAAVLAGVVAFGVVQGVLNVGIGIVAALIVIAAIGRTGGVRLRKRDPSAHSAPIWAAIAIFVFGLSLTGSGGIFMALVAAASLGHGWRSTPQFQA